MSQSIAHYGAAVGRYSTSYPLSVEFFMTNFHIELLQCQ